MRRARFLLAALAVAAAGACARADAITGPARTPGRLNDAATGQPTVPAASGTQNAQDDSSSVGRLGYLGSGA